MSKINLEELEKITLCFELGDSYSFDINIVEELNIKAHSPQRLGDEDVYGIYDPSIIDELVPENNNDNFIARIPTKTCYVDDGYIFLKRNLAENVKHSPTPFDDEETLERFTFGKSCYSENGNISYIILSYKNKDIEECFIPCRTFEGQYINLIDFSNCPSCEHDEDFYRFYFGKSSTAPTRIDDKYSKIIKDFPFDTKEILKVIPTYFCQDYDFEKDSYEICAKLKIVDGEHKGKEITLHFANTKALSFEYEKGEVYGAEEFMISQFEDRTIWVSLGVYGEFFCNEIKFIE